MKELENSRVVVLGHYGSGKTNFAVNLALQRRAAGAQVVLCDLDIVNPYFRSSDFAARVEAQGIEMVSPPFAGSNVDLPALSGRLDGVLAEQGPRQVILDVGGDDAGAVALGRYARVLLPRGPAVLYVVNARRPVTDTPAAALEILREIEAVSRIRATHIVNNTNLGAETTPRVLEESQDYIRELCRLSGLPLCCHAVDAAIAGQVVLDGPVLPVEVLVRPPWDQA